MSGLSPVCTRLCIVIAEPWANSFPQNYRFIGMCVRACVGVGEGVGFALTLHLYGFSPVCVRMCCWRACGAENSLPHSSHVQLLTAILGGSFNTCVIRYDTEGGKQESGTYIQCGSGGAARLCPSG